MNNYSFVSLEAAQGGSRGTRAQVQSAENGTTTGDRTPRPKKILLRGSITRGKKTQQRGSMTWVTFLLPIPHPTTHPPNPLSVHLERATTEETRKRRLRFFHKARVFGNAKESASGLSLLTCFCPYVCFTELLVWVCLQKSYQYFNDLNIACHRLFNLSR